MSKIDDGGPAYPHTNPNWNVNGDRRPEIPGMSLRDWFAGQALAAIGGPIATASPESMEKAARDDGFTGTRGEYTAYRAYVIADSMLQARKEKEE